MKNLIIFGLFIIALVLVQFVQAQTVDDIIERHIVAKGGKENLYKIKNIIMIGSLNYKGTEIGLVLTQVHNKLNRQDITINGVLGFEMLTDKEGWKYMPIQGMQKPEPKTTDEIKESKSDLDVTGPLFNYAAKGHKVELVGKEDVDGTLCYKIKATLAGGKEMTFYIDTASSMIIRVKNKSIVNGQQMEVQNDFSDYKEVAGVKMPHSITQQFGTILISSIKVNQTIPEAAFKHGM